jgi:hypothetical protein
MSIQQLLSIVPPPKDPLLPDNPAVVWRDIEQQLGIQLPDELYQVATQYGRGCSVSAEVAQGVS